MSVPVSLQAGAEDKKMAGPSTGQSDMPIDPDDLLPAVGQGALALECRGADDRTRALLAAVDHAPSATATVAERAFLVALGGDCNTPLAAHATLAGSSVRLRVVVCDPDGERKLADDGTAAAGDAESLGRSLAERLLSHGAAEILGR